MDRNISFQTLIQDLKNNKVSVADISMSYLKDVACITLAEALAKNTSLQRIHLQYCYISDKGCIALANSLKQNRTLKHLDL